MIRFIRRGSNRICRQAPQISIIVDSNYMYINRYATEKYFKNIDYIRIGIENDKIYIVPTNKIDDGVFKINKSKGTKHNSKVGVTDVCREMSLQKGFIYYYDLNPVIKEKREMLELTFTTKKAKGKERRENKNETLFKEF